MRRLTLSAATALGTVARVLRPAVSILPGAAGAVLVTAGSALIFPPAGFIIAGLFLLVIDWKMS